MGKGKNNIQSASSTGYDDDDERSLSRLMLDENSWGPLSTSRKVSLSSRSARIELRDKLYVGFIKRKKKGSNGARLIYFLLAPIPPAGWQLLTGEGKACTDRIRLSALCWAGKNQRGSCSMLCWNRSQSYEENPDIYYKSYVHTEFNG